MYAYLVCLVLMAMAMRKNVNHHHWSRIYSERKWIIPFFVSILVSLTLLLTSYFGLYTLLDDMKVVTSEDDMKRSLAMSDNLKKNKSEPPRLAYLISGTKGDNERIMRVLQAVYHPRNQYVLHIDLEDPARERLDLRMYVKSDPTFREVENVRVMDKSNLVTYRGPTMLACALQAMAILLKESLHWDLFIKLSASDYPLMTQDDMLHVFSNLSRNLNFIEFSPAGWSWKLLDQRAKSIIVDPGLYLSKKSDLVNTTQRRSLPTAFKLFSGSAWVVVTRSFVEYCIWGWGSFPRTILMYLTNFLSSPESYFQTVICNTEEFRNTALGHDLHYIAWHNPPRQHPRILSMQDFDKMVESGAPFACKFGRNDPVLDKIDKEVLGRSHIFAPGAWCIGNSSTGVDPCSLRGNSSDFKPGPGAVKLRELIGKLLSHELRTKKCSSK